MPLKIKQDERRCPECLGEVELYDHQNLICKDCKHIFAWS